MNELSMRTRGWDMRTSTIAEYHEPSNVHMITQASAAQVSLRLRISY